MSNITVGIHGFSFEISSFKELFENAFKHHAKQTIDTVANRFLGSWAKSVMIASRYLAPASYTTDNGVVNITAKGDSLANSIVIGDRQLNGAIKHIEVGVDSSLWHSNYVREFKKAYNNQTPPWGVNPKRLALFIHEYWDKFTANKPMAKARAAKKEATPSESYIMKDFRGDRHVGEKFLYRGALGASHAYNLVMLARAEMFSAFKNTPYGTPFTIGKYTHLLENPAPTFGIKNKNDEPTL